MQPFIIGVAGGTASGKTSVCSRIIEKLEAVEAKKRVVIISQDSFYQNLHNAADIEKAQRGEFNFDHPNAFDHSLLVSCIGDLRAGNSVKIPKYDFCKHCRVADSWIQIDASDVIMVEGILIFYDPELRKMFDMKLFVDADPDIRLARRVERDTMVRGRNLNQVIHQYLGLVKPAFEEFVLPCKKYADVIIPRGADNEVAINLIVKHIEEILRTPKNTPERSEPTGEPSTTYTTTGDGKIRQISRPH